MTILVRKQDQGRKKLYNYLKYYIPPLSPIQEENDNDVISVSDLLSRQNSALSRQTSNSSLPPGEYVAKLIDYEITPDTYLMAIEDIEREYDSDCGIFTEYEKINKAFKYLISVNELFKLKVSKKNINKVKESFIKGIKKIRILSDECFVRSNTQINLNMITTFFEKIITYINKNE